MPLGVGTGIEPERLSAMPASRRMTARLVKPCVTAATLLLLGCGGGGSSSPFTLPADSPLQSAAAAQESPQQRMVMPSPLAAGPSDEDDAGAAQAMPASNAVAMEQPTAKAVVEATLGRSWYVSPAGSDRAAGTAEQPFESIQRGIDAAKPGDIVTIRAGVYKVSRPIRITGKHASADQLISIIGMGAVTITGVDQSVPGVWAGLLEITDASYVRVQGIAVERSSFFGIKVVRSQHIELIENKSTVSLASGIYVQDSQDVRVERNDISRFCDRNQFGADGRTGCQEGISIVNVDGFYVGRNLVHDAPQGPDVMPGGGEGIDIKSGSRNGAVEANSVWNLVQLGIYIDAYRAGASNIKVRANRIWRTYMGIVINSEQGGTVADVDVSDNLIHDVGYHGILIDDLKKERGGDGPRQQIRIYNNTIVSAGVKEAKPPYCRLWSNPCIDTGLGIKVATTNITGLDIHDNIILDAKSMPMMIEPTIRSSSRIERNLVWSQVPSSLTRDFIGSSPIIADPLLVDAAGGDYRLQPGSPAIGTGVGGAPLGLDITGRQRPANGPIDLGAFMFVAN